jgi:hypothetical protein
MTRSTDLAVFSRVAKRRQGPFTGTPNLDHREMVGQGFDFGTQKKSSGTDEFPPPPRSYS